jgi:hypothetical protein
LYYKLTDEDMQEITKEWPAEFLLPVDKTELSNPNIIEIPMVTREEYDGPSSSKKKIKEEVQEINNASEENASESPGGGGDDEVDQKEDEGEEEKKEQGEVTPPKDPHTESEMSKKRKVSPNKPSTQKKSQDKKPQLQTILTVDDIDLIIIVVSDTSKDILQ